MTGATNKKSLTRDEAAAIYEDLRKNFAAYTKEGATINKNPKLKFNPGKVSQQRPLQAANSGYSNQNVNRNFQGATPEEQIMSLLLAKQAQQKEGKIGKNLAILMVILAAGFKFTLGALEYTEVLSPSVAQATISANQTNSSFSSEQIGLLKALDSRRVELEERRKSLDKREEEIANKDREFAIKLAELRELTQTLKGNRELESKKRTTQLDQLSNVYGSMDPKEAAVLIEQLDDVIAIELLNRMPEKRIGQILALMNKEKALMMTKMLSGKYSAE